MDPKAQQLANDLQYVRQAVTRHHRPSATVQIPLVWAGINLVGWALLDFRPAMAPAFWLMAVPVGMAASFYLGRKAALRNGRVSWADGRRHFFHWMIIPVATALMLPILAQYNLNTYAGFQLVLLLIGVVYTLGGLHLDRSFTFGGLAMLIGVAVLTWPVTGSFTIVGIMIATGLTLGAWLAGRSNR